MRKILLNLKGVLMGTLLVVCLCSCGKNAAYYVEEVIPSETTLEAASEEVELEVTESKGIYVYVCGQIQNPGVYVLTEGSRICDLFVMAGGFTKTASTDYWNQARLLKDGEMIYVPSKEEVKGSILQMQEGNAGKDNESDKVNINTASKEELMTIPGIGEAKATAIIAYRKEHGDFASIDEVKNVEGIKDGVYSKMKDYIEI